MKTKTLVLLGLAVVFGLIASFLTSKLLSDRSNAAVEEEEKVTVLVAKQNLAYGQKLDVPENYFEEKQYSPDNVPARAITNSADLKDRLLAGAIKKGIPITKDDLLAQELIGLPGKMPPGKRGVALQANAVAAAGGLILPDNHVDVMLTTSADTKVILSNMLVLAVDTHQKVEPGSSIIPQTVTLLADPEQAAVLSHAQSKGKIQLTVRPFNDVTDSSRIRVTDQDLGTLGNNGNNKIEDVTPGATDLIALRQVTPKLPEKTGEKTVDKTTEKTTDDTGSAPPVKKRRAFVQVLYNGSERILNYFDDETGKAILPEESDQYDLPGRKL